MIQTNCTFPDIYRNLPDDVCERVSKQVMTSTTHHFDRLLNRVRSDAQRDLISSIEDLIFHYNARTSEHNFPDFIFNRGLITGFNTVLAAFMIDSVHNCDHCGIEYMMDTPDDTMCEFCTHNAL